MALQELTRKRISGGTAGSPPSASPQIPDKLYFRIGEVAKLCAVPAYVLRFWESEFPQLKPNKGGTGQRLYRRRDVEMALRIKTLLYDEGYTIPGARQAFKAELRSGKDPQSTVSTVGPVSEAPAPSDLRIEAHVDPRHLLALRTELQDILRLLSRPAVPKSAVLPIRGSFAASRAEIPAAATQPAAPRPFLKPQLLHRMGPTLFDD